MEGEEEEEDYASYSAYRPKYGTFRTTCTRFVVLYASLVMAGLCAAALIMYTELPVGHYQDLDSVTMLFDHRKAAKGIQAEHEYFRKETWARDVQVASLENDVTEVSRHIPVALYCGGTRSLCDKDVQVECLSKLTSVNTTHSLNADQDGLVASVQYYGTCTEFNALEWGERAERIRVFHVALTGSQPEDLGLSLVAESAFWSTWVCSNFASLPGVLASKKLTCTRTFDLCAPTSNAITGIKGKPSNLDFFRIARSSVCLSGPSIQVYHDSVPLGGALDLASRDFGWVLPQEIEAFFDAAFATVFGQNAEPYSRVAISDALSVSGIKVSFDFATEEGDGMETGKYVGALASQVSTTPVPATCPNTAYTVFHGTGSVSLSVDSYNESSSFGTSGMIPVSMGADAKHVPLYQVTPNSEEGDWASFAVSRLTKLEVVVAKSAILNQHLWRISRVSAEYGSGSTQEEVVQLQVDLRDASEPRKAQVPVLDQEYYALAALALMVIAGIIVFMLPFILYREYILGLKANGLPLPFFRYTTQFRGW